MTFYSCKNRILTGDFWIIENLKLSEIGIARQPCEASPQEYSAPSMSQASAKLLPAATPAK